MDLNKENLWSILEIGDRAVQKLKKKVYMIVGLTKNGKSCLFNHILGKPMVGKQDQEDCQRVVYVPQQSTAFKLTDYAEMGSTAVSITLAPNIANFNYEYSLIDMLGFQENRNQKSTLCVSYFLSSCFDRAECVKFIVAISEQNLFSKNMKIICDSFNQLVDMVAISKLASKLKENFLDSIALVVTSARNNLGYNKKRLQTIIKQLGNAQLQTLKNREIIREIIQRIHAKERIECFVQAEAGKVNQKCTVVDNLHQKQWFEFNLKVIEKTLGAPAINIRFKEEFGKLQNIFASRFKQSLKHKIQCLLKINQIFRTYLQELRQNWAKNNLLNITTQRVKKLIRQTLQHKMYNQSAIRQRNLIIPINNTQNIFEIVKKSLEIYDLTTQLEKCCNPELSQIMTFDQQMDHLTEIYTKIMDCLVPAFTDNKQLQNLVQIQFMLSRSFKEFKKFNQLDPEMITTITRDMCDKALLQLNKREHLEHFANKIDRNVLNQLFKNMASLAHYQRMLQDYMRIVSSDKLDNQLFSIKYLRMKLNAKEIKDQLLNKGNNKWAIVKNLIELVQIQLQLYSLYNSPNLRWIYDDLEQHIKNFKTKVNNFIKKDDTMTQSRIKMIDANRQYKLEESYNSIVRNINVLMELLQTISFKQYSDGYSFILKLSSLIKNPTFADRILTTQLIEEYNRFRKIDILEQHIALCKRWGWVQQGSKLLLSKREIHLQLSQNAKIKQTNEELKKLGKQQIKWSQMESTMNSLGTLFNLLQINSLHSILQSILKDCK